MDLMQNRIYQFSNVFRAKDDNPKAFYQAEPVKDNVPGEVVFEQLYSWAEGTLETNTITTDKEMTEEGLIKARVFERDSVKIFASPIDQHKEFTRHLIQNFRIEDKPSLNSKPKIEERVLKGKIKMVKGASSKLAKEKAKETQSGFSFTIKAKKLFSGQCISPDISRMGRF